ncbi:LysR family transcriptional regulator [Cupriavidus basilensis]
MNLELRHYRYFAALAEELHFGRAAERLGISQPALSQQFRWIEQEAGAPLLSRSKRRLALTEVGAVFHEEALGVLRQVRHAELATASASRGDLGSASIGYVASAALSEFAAEACLSLPPGLSGRAARHARDGHAGPA